jgi:hypothetical protein
MKSTMGCALITGGSQGLGRALAEECAGRGMDLVLVALPDTGLRPLSEILRRAYEVRIETVEMDLTDPESVGILRTLVQEKDFPIDTLINNAGIGFTSRFTESSVWQNEATVQLNVAALVRLTQAMLPLLRERPRAWILNVASIGAFYPMPSMPVYSSTKGFVLNFSLLLREELRGSSVSVSVLCPNGIRTNRGCRALIDRQGWAGRIMCHYPDEVARIALRGLLRKRGVIVPGLVNRALRHASPLVPRGIYMKAIARRWGTEKRKETVRALGAEA